MGTRGYRVYRFRGRYYIFYNHWDSYPEGLGSAIVDEIPLDLEEYEKWLRALHEKFSKWEEMLITKVLAISNDITDLLHIGGSDNVSLEPRFKVYLDERMEGTPSYMVPCNDLWIEWVYIIDLDYDLFIVDNGAHFELAKVPKSGSYPTWAKALASVGGTRKLLTSCLPKEAVPHRPGNIEGDNSQYPTPLDIGTFQADTCSQESRAGPIFFCKIWKDFRHRLIYQLPYTPIQLRPTDFTFREIAYSILSLAAGLTGTVALISQQRVKRPADPDWIAIIQGNDPEGPSDVVSKTALGYHREGDSRPGSAPEETTYWFKNALVHLSGDLTGQGLQKAIVEAIQHGCSTAGKGKSFNAVLLSIRHVVLLKYSPSILQMTELLPLSGAAKDADASFSNHYMRDKCSDIDEKEEMFDCATTIGGCFEQVRHTEPPEYEARLDSTFFALVDFFEDSVRSSLKSEQSREGVFPTEIYSEILGYVDMDTQRACIQVCRKFYEICQQQIFITQDLVLTGYEASNESFRFRDNARKKMIDIKTIDIKISFDPSSASEFYIIYGYQAPQSIRSSPASTFSFIGTCLLGDFQDDNPWPNYEYPAIEIQPLMGVEEATHFWSDRSISMYIRPGSRRVLDCSSNLSVGEAQEMWQLIFGFYDLELTESLDPDWARPPHTRVAKIQVGKKWNLRKASLCYAEIGRPNAFHDTDGTFRHLRASAEDKVRKQLEESKQNWTDVFVLLAIDRSAELYRFAVTSNRLEQYADAEKGRLKIFDSRDRETVERYLKHIKDSVQAAKEGMTLPADNRSKRSDD